MHRPSYMPGLDWGAVLAELADDFEADIQPLERQVTSLRAQLQELEDRPASSLTSADVRAVVSEVVRVRLKTVDSFEYGNSLRILFDWYLRRGLGIESHAERRGLCSVKKAAREWGNSMYARISVLENFRTEVILQRVFRAEVVLTNVAGDIVLRFAVSDNDWIRCFQDNEDSLEYHELEMVPWPRGRGLGHRRAKIPSEVLDDAAFSLQRLVRHRLSEMALTYHKALFTIIKERIEEAIHTLWQRALQAEEHDQAVYKKQNQQQSLREDDPQQTQDQQTSQDHGDEIVAPNSSCLPPLTVWMDNGWGTTRRTHTLRIRGAEYHRYTYSRYARSLVGAPGPLRTLHLISRRSWAVGGSLALLVRQERAEGGGTKGAF